MSRAMGRTILLLSAWIGVVPARGVAQDPNLARARQAYQDLDYTTAIVAARRALAGRITREERIEAYELLGFTYGALDSTRRAVEAFRELIFLDPDREPDVQRVSPRITSLYGSALGQVLVVRKIRVDSTSFVAGLGRVPIQLEMTRPGRVLARMTGEGLDLPVDSLSLGSGSVRLSWSGLLPDSAPVPPGSYQLVIEASAGRDRFAAVHPVRVSHSPVDTLPHLTSAPGYTEQPEMVRPGRNWRPLGVATLYTAIASGASLALENTTLGSPTRREIGGVSFAVILTGFIMSLKKPDPVPVPANILYNQLLREELARRNAEIAARNAARRRQVLLTVRSGGTR